MRTRPLAVFAVIALAAAGGVATAAERGLTVVELFTSQGCSSCPPADALIGELAKRPDVLPLAFHVDYWDYIGWKDVFARPEHTARQKAYARLLGLRQVYTPQMIFDGTAEAVGSDRVKVLHRIAEAAKAVKVPIALDRDGGHLVVRVEAAPLPPGLGGAGLFLTTFERDQVTQIARGENRGVTLRNANIVRSFRQIGEWKGTPTRQTIETSELPPGIDGAAVLIQTLPAGPILGAAAITLESLSAQR